MSKQIKLIWDFYGEDALKTAEHHAIHLKEFVTKNEIESFDVGAKEGDKLHATAYIVVAEENMLILRDSLRPKRGQWVEDKI